MKKPRFISWEFLQGKVDSPYEAVIILSKEARRLNSVPQELQTNRKTKITTQAALRLFDKEINYEYSTPEKK